MSFVKYSSLMSKNKQMKPDTVSPTQPIGTPTRPLDEHVEIVSKRFPKYISIQETKCNAMKEHGVLFKKAYYNEYCYLEYDKRSHCVLITLFKSDWKDFEKTEDDFLKGFSFAVTDKSETFVIINTLV